jgi:hypothetical protein
MVGISEVDGTNAQIQLPQISKWLFLITFAIANCGSMLPVHCSGLPSFSGCAAIPFFDNN